MNGIIGFSELLKDPLLSGEEQSEYLSLIQQSGNRMLALINDLMAISKIDARELKLQQTETPLNRLMQDLLAFFKLQADKKGLRLTLSKGLSDEASIISLDSLKLNQILTNLIQNALKFTNKGGIDIGYTRNDGTLHFFVIDSGIGIPGENKNRIFDRFHQVDNSLTRNHEGAGLGLSISKALVEMLGGSIKVESVEGAGSSFSFTIPYNPLHLPTADCQLPTSPCILLAEDDAVSTLLIKRNLKGENLTILSAENGWEAVELLQHHPEIKLVLMDLKMPIMNGYEASRLIKKQRPDLPVIAQSAFTSKEERQKAKEAGCDDFITKPISKSELLEKMHKQLKWQEVVL
jgi:CheY-like chemotaxis protein/two-component sensor histidine kinase